MLIIYFSQELRRLFEAVRGAQQNNDVPMCRLSQESLQCLETNLIDNPVLVHWIIDGLLCIWLPTRFAQSDSALQDVYVSSLRQLLESPTCSEITENDESLMSSNLQTNSRLLGKERWGVLLSILSKLDLTDTKEDELLAWLFPELLKSCNTDDVELALYARKNLKFFKAWHEFLDDTYARCHPADSLDNARKVSSILFNFHENTETGLNANEIFARTLRRQSHWLTDIFVSSRGG